MTCLLKQKTISNPQNLREGWLLKHSRCVVGSDQTKLVSCLTKESVSSVLRLTLTIISNVERTRNQNDRILSCISAFLQQRWRIILANENYIFYYIDAVRLILLYDIVRINMEIFTKSFTLTSLTKYCLFSNIFFIVTHE